MKIVYSPKCLEYKQLNHPESPDRVRNAVEYPNNKGLEYVNPKKASEEDLRIVHSKDLIERVRKRNFSDPDSPRYEEIYGCATLSAGAAIKAQETNSFSLMRPPATTLAKIFWAASATLTISL